MNYPTRIFSFILFAVMICSVGCDKFSRSTESAENGRSQAYQPEDPKVAAERKRIMEIRNKIEKNVYDGIQFYYDRGPARLEDEFHFTNRSNYDLREINLKVTYKLGSGKELASTHFWGTWNVNTTQILTWSAENYQQVRIKGTAKLAKPVDGIREIDIEMYWNL